MIVLDTNVISELMRPKPHPRVLTWVANLPRPLLHTTHINQAEILYGIAALPEGRRRAALAAEPMQCSRRTLPVACCRSAQQLRRVILGSY